MIGRVKRRGRWWRAARVLVLSGLAVVVSATPLRTGEVIDPRWAAPADRDVSVSRASDGARPLPPESVAATVGTVADLPAVVRPETVAPATAPAPPAAVGPARGLPEVPKRGTGELAQVGRDRPATVTGRREVRYRVEVEGGLPVPRAGFAALVHQILGDPRGWQAVEDVRFVQVRNGSAPITVTLASPDTTDELCAPLRTRGQLSCWTGSRAVLNAARWVHGAETYGTDVTNYRRYLVSHEVGHGIGKGHVGCPRPGAPAPVMVQQTKSLLGCRPNPWPAP